MRKLLLCIGIALVAIGCTKDADVSLSGDNVLTITSNIATRVTDGEWEEKDAIGVYMTTSSTIEDKLNMEYTTTNGDGIFTSTSPIYLPSEGAVTIFAYYPYVAGVDLTAYSINSADQVDLLSALASNVTSSNVALEFDHLLSKVSLTIEAGYGVSDSELEGLEVKLSGIGTTATFNLDSNEATTTNTDSELTLTTVTDGTSSSAIVIPQDLSGVTLTFTTSNYTFSAPLATSEFEVGKEYTYTATINSDEVEITSSNINAWESDDNNSDATTGTATIVDIEYKNEKYYINSAKGLAAFRELVNLNGDNSSLNATFAGFEESAFAEANTGIDGVLTCNIDLGEIYGNEVDGGTSWSTIGYYSGGDCYYEGTFDGGGYEISGLYINTSANQQALFRGISSTGVVCNLGVSGTAKNTSTTFTEFGGITAWNNGNIFNCYTDIEIDGSSITSVGGIAAYNSSTGKVVNCYNLKKVVGKVNIGGIVGFNEGGYVGYCFNTGAVTTSTGLDNGYEISNDVFIKYGGVVGYNDDYGVDSNTDTVKGSFCLENTDYSIGQVATTAVSGTLNTNVCTAEYLTSATFTTTMNNGAATYNSTYTTSTTPTYITACAWVYNDGSYPTHDFYVEPEYKNLDIIYNSVSYTINTANGLLAFAALVNGSDMPTGTVTSSNVTSDTNDVFFLFGTVHSNIDGKLADNITLDSGTSISIGIDGYPYIGTFDFNDKTIKIGEETTYSGDSYSGLFYTTD